MFWRYQGHLVAAALSLIFAGGACSPAEAATLNGIMLFSAESDGNRTGVEMWNTVGTFDNITGDTYIYNLYLKQGSGYVNSGNTPNSVGLNYNLTPGTHVFTIEGSPSPTGTTFGFWGMNVFINGTAAPLISARGAVRNSAAGSDPAFFANGAANTRTLDNAGLIPGADTLSFMEGNWKIELTQFSYATYDVFNTNVVGDFNNTPDSLGVGIHPRTETRDFAGQMTISVTAMHEAPEPSTWAMLGAGVAGLITLSRRRRKA